MNIEDYEQQLDKHILIKSLYAKRGVEIDEVDPIEFEVMEEYASSKWISVDDRLPDFNQRNGVIECTDTVLLFGVHGTTVGWFRKLIRNGKIDSQGTGIVDRYSTHWQPLPNPPKK